MEKGETMTIKFCIKESEIQDIIQFSKLQGGSKYRQRDIFLILDRVVARKDFAEKDFAEKTSLERQGVEFL